MDKYHKLVDEIMFHISFFPFHSIPSHHLPSYRYYYLLPLQNKKKNSSMNEKYLKRFKNVCFLVFSFLLFFQYHN